MSLNLTAYYTNAIWRKHQLAPPWLSTWQADLLCHSLRPLINSFEKYFGVQLDRYLLNRHKLINARMMQRLLKEPCQVLEIAAGLSGRAAYLCQHYPDLDFKYVETDLSSLIHKKRSLYTKHLGAEKRLCLAPVDICHDFGELRLEQVAARLCDKDKPVIIIMEGLSHYLPLHTFKQVYYRLAQLLAGFPDAELITDYMPYKSYGYNTDLDAFSWFLRKATKSPVQFHFQSPEQLVDVLYGLGLEAVTQPVISDAAGQQGVIVSAQYRAALKSALAG